MEKLAGINLADPAGNHMLVSMFKACMSQYTPSPPHGFNHKACKAKLAEQSLPSRACRAELAEQTFQARASRQKHQGKMLQARTGLQHKTPTEQQRLTKRRFWWDRHRSRKIPAHPYFEYCICFKAKDGWYKPG